MDMIELAEPRGHFQVLVRRLAEEAVSAIHHDAPEPEYSNEVRSLERRFTDILRGYLSARSRASRALSAKDESHD